MLLYCCHGSINCLLVAKKLIFNSKTVVKGAKCVALFLKSIKPLQPKTWSRYSTIFLVYICVYYSLVYCYFEKGCRKNVHATIPKGNMGYDQYTVSDDCTCRTYFCCFPLARANPLPRPFVPILLNSELKTTHNVFRDRRVHIFRQPFSK